MSLDLANVTGGQRQSVPKYLQGDWVHTETMSIVTATEMVGDSILCDDNKSYSKYDFGKILKRANKLINPLRGLNIGSIANGVEGATMADVISKKEDKKSAEQVPVQENTNESVQETIKEQPKTNPIEIVDNSHQMVQSAINVSSEKGEQSTELVMVNIKFPFDHKKVVEVSKMLNIDLETALTIILANIDTDAVVSDLKASIKGMFTEPKISGIVNSEDVRQSESSACVVSERLIIEGGEAGFVEATGQTEATEQVEQTPKKQKKNFTDFLKI